MKRTEITPKMFEQWKAEQRQYFQSKDPKSMNLINFCLGGHDETPPTEEEVAKREKVLMQFYENQLALEGRLECEFCGAKMEVYYTVHCFHCQEGKPKVDKNLRGNYLMATRWLENNEKDFNSQWVWEYLLNHDILKGNDSYITLPDADSQSEFYNKQINLFKKHFEIKNVLWLVSW